MVFSTNKYGMTIVDITPEMRAFAVTNAWNLGVLRKSHLGLNANLVGSLGEQAVLAVLAPHGAYSNNTYQYDIMLPLDDEIYKLEVKTKNRTVECRLDYEGSVAQITPNQTADFYVFCSLIRQKEGWKKPAKTKADLEHNAELFYRTEIAGMISPDEFRRLSYDIETGEEDQAGKSMPIKCKNIKYDLVTQFNL